MDAEVARPTRERWRGEAFLGRGLNTFRAISSSSRSSTGAARNRRDGADGEEEDDDDDDDERGTRVGGGPKKKAAVEAEIEIELGREYVCDMSNKEEVDPDRVAECFAVCEPYFAPPPRECLALLAARATTAGLDNLTKAASAATGAAATAALGAGATLMIAVPTSKPGASRKSSASAPAPPNAPAVGTAALASGRVPVALSALPLPPRGQHYLERWRDEDGNGGSGNGNGSGGALAVPQAAAVPVGALVGGRKPTAASAAATSTAMAIASASASAAAASVYDSEDDDETNDLRAAMLLPPMRDRVHPLGGSGDISVGGIFSSSAATDFECDGEIVDGAALIARAALLAGLPAPAPVATTTSTHANHTATAAGMPPSAASLLASASTALSAALSSASSSASSFALDAWHASTDWRAPLDVPTAISVCRTEAALRHVRAAVTRGREGREGE